MAKAYLKFEKKSQIKKWIKPYKRTKFRAIIAFYNKTK